MANPTPLQTTITSYATLEAAQIADKLAKLKIAHRYYRLGREHAFVLTVPVQLGRIWFEQYGPEGWRWDRQVGGFVKVAT